MIGFRTDGKWGMLILLAIAVVFAFNPALPTSEAASGDVYYVAPEGDDSNPGTESQPWRTIQKAADTMVAGDTVYVRAGTYSGRVDLQNSGTTNNYITFKAYPGEQPVLDGGGWAGFTDYYASSPLEYYVIDGFEIKNFDDDGAILLGKSSHVILRNNKVHNNQNGIWMENGVGFDIHHNVAYSNSRNGIAISHGAENNLVRHNTVYDNSCGEWQSFAGIAIEVDSENNKVYNNLIYNNCNAGYVTNSPNNEIYNNVMYGNKGTQISFGDWEGSTPINNVVKNNIFVVTRDSDCAVVCWRYATDYDYLQNTYDNNLYYYVNGPDKSDMVFIESLGKGSFSEWQDIGKERHGVLGRPQFVNLGSNNFHLQANSPAIDAGADVEVTEDFDSNPRPQGAGCDIGAYEYVAVGPTPTSEPSPTTATPTPTPTYTSTPTNTPIPMPTNTPVATPTSTPMRTNTPIPTSTPTSTATNTPTATPTPVTPTATPTNQPPVADAGSNQTVTDADGDGSEAVALDGSGSTDNDGTIVSYEWSEGGNPIATGVNPQVTLAVGTHTITLMVTDDDGATGTDTVVITVNAPPQSGLITDIVVSNGKTYEKDTLATGKLIYIDRSYTFTSVPAAYRRQQFIRTANNDKRATNADFLTFTLTGDATVYIAYDIRATRLPAWLDGSWTDTGDTIGTSDVTRRLYKKDFAAGTVTLGGNAMVPMAGAGSNYNVIAIAAGSPPTDTPTPVTPTATPTNQPPVADAGSEQTVTDADLGETCP